MNHVAVLPCAWHLADAAIALGLVLAVVVITLAVAGTVMAVRRATDHRKRPVLMILSTLPILAGGAASGYWSAAVPMMLAIISVVVMVFWPTNRKAGRN